MTPIRGWSPRGSKLVAHAPFGKWRTLTFLAALRHDWIDAPCVLDGSMQRDNQDANVATIRMRFREGIRRCRASLLLETRF